MANLNIPFVYIQNKPRLFEIDGEVSTVIPEQTKKPATIQIFQESQLDSKLPRLPNNLVLSDRTNGTIVLCHHDSVTTLNSKNNSVSKFLVTVKPKLLCVTSILPDPLQAGKEYLYKLMDTCVISSPASQLLSTSVHLLVTVQNDQNQNSEIKLWSQSDGRCIMTSPKHLFKDKPLIRII